MPHLFSEAAYRISDRPGLWRRAVFGSDNSKRVADKVLAKFGNEGQTRNFVRWREVERAVIDAIGLEVVTDRDLMFCDFCGDCPRSVVQFDDGVLCRECAKGSG